jgi:hypothetical protein
MSRLGKRLFENWLTDENLILPIGIQSKVILNHIENISARRRHWDGGVARQAAFVSQTLCLPTRAPPMAARPRPLAGFLFFKRYRFKALKKKICIRGLYAFCIILAFDGTLRPTLAHVRSFAVVGYQLTFGAEAQHRGFTRLYARCLRAAEQLSAHVICL